jgi:hypothetical protein
MTDVGSNVTVTVCPSSHVAAERFTVATVPWLLITTLDTDGITVHVPATVKLDGVLPSCSENVKLTDDGIVSTEPVPGVTSTSAGAVVSIVMDALSGDCVDGWPAASTTVPASTWTVTTPLPLQSPSVIVAPLSEIELTETVHDGSPLTVDTVTPPPFAVSESVSAVPPESEGA